jgi:alanine racemase
MESYLTAEISASAVTANIATLRKRLAPGTKMCAVVKADCYGHGLKLLLGVLSANTDCFAVATPEEALVLRGMGYERPVLVFFSACAMSDGKECGDLLTELIRKQVILTVVCGAEVALVAKAAAAVGAVAQVHMKLDTGMGRSGIAAAAAHELAATIRSQKWVKLSGMYTHFAAADELDKAHMLGQLDRFTKAVASCGGHSGLTLHVANSAATIDVPQSHLDMVRPGIAMWGYQPSGEMVNVLPLQPCMRLVGPLMQTRQMPAGSCCGYGLTHKFTRASRVGLVPIGYGDGYFRAFSNKAVMHVCGHDVPIPTDLRSAPVHTDLRYAPICGRVSMDQTIIDLTDIPQAQVGDQVEIISNNPAAPNSVENLAKIAGTIPYELTCRLGNRVRRKLVD